MRALSRVSLPAWGVAELEENEMAWGTTLRMTRRPARTRPSAVRYFRAVLMIVALTGIAGSVPAAEWDQERVTALAVELHKIVNDLRVVARQAGAVTQGQPRQDRIRRLAVDNLKQLRASTRQLVSALESGQGAEETRRTLRRVNMLANDTAELVRSAAISPQTQAMLAAGGGLLDELDHYYGTLDGLAEGEAPEAPSEEAAD